MTRHHRLRCSGVVARDVELDCKILTPNAVLNLDHQFLFHGILQIPRHFPYEVSCAFLFAHWMFYQPLELALFPSPLSPPTSSGERRVLQEKAIGHFVLMSDQGKGGHQRISAQVELLPQNYHTVAAANPEGLACMLLPAWHHITSFG